jgi:hypothetical protein
VVGGEPCRKLPLTQGQYAIVDADIYDYLMQWNWFARWDSKGKRYYASVSLKDEVNKTFRHQEMSRTIIGLQWWNKVKVDHRNHNGLDNRRSNLRKSNDSQNQANACLRTDNTSGYKGVVRSKNKSGGWIAKIQVNGKDIYLGRFADIIEATKAYDNAARQHFGEFAMTNFPIEHSSS